MKELSSVRLLMMMCSLSYSLAVSADETSFEISGSARAAYWSEDKSYNDDTDFMASSLWLQARAQNVLGAQIYAEGYIINDNSFRNSKLQGQLREAYVEKSFDTFDFKVGRQIIVWGRADKVNPTDQFSTYHYKRLFTETEDQRLGAFSTQMTYHLGETKFIFIWSPEWVPSQFPLKPQTGLTLVEQKPEQSQNQFGLKVDQTGDQFDWSVSLFDGVNKVPDLKPIDLSAQGATVALTYNRIQVLGADFATTYGSTGFRGEIAYTQTEDREGKDDFKQNPFVYLVLGLDRTLFENFNLNIQGLYRQVQNFQSEISQNAALKSLVDNQSLLTQQQYREQTGLSIRPQYSLLNETLTLEIAYVTWFNQRDSLVRPKLTYQYNDQTRFIVGAEYFDGPKDSFFGRLKETNTSFVEFRYLF